MSIRGGDRHHLDERHRRGGHSWRGPFGMRMILHGPTDDFAAVKIHHGAR